MATDEQKQKQEKRAKSEVSLTRSDVDHLVGEIQASNLSEESKVKIVQIVRLVLSLRELLERRTGRLLSLLKKIFGVKTEKGAKKKPKDAAGEEAKDQDKKKARRQGGEGRNGRDDYPGAEKIAVPHTCLKPGDRCPACLSGRLEDGEPAIRYRWFGREPLILKIYLLERLICQTCKDIFTAPLPVENEASPSQGREREFDASAGAMLATLRFESGVPHYRLAEIQAQQGLPLAPATQYKVMTEALAKPATVVAQQLKKIAGESGKLFINDDTHGRIIDVERGIEKPQEHSHRSKVQTSAIVVQTEEGHTICLHETGVQNAGESLAKILSHRDVTETPAPMQMCDGLAVNQPGEFQTIVGNCLDHARRKYKDVETKFPDEVTFVIATLAQVYKNDADAKKANLSAEERLVWHQKHSARLMEELKTWAETQFSEKKVEKNSLLGQSITYMLKRWTKLTAFLRIAGMPLSSSEVERLIKRAIRHRKNSLHYKTLKGAKFGDLMMTLIQTCRYAKVNSFQYLTALARYSASVLENPQLWLPWNFTEAVATIKT